MRFKSDEIVSVLRTEIEGYGKKLQVEVLRDGAKLAFDLKVEARPAA